MQLILISALLVLAIHYWQITLGIVAISIVSIIVAVLYGSSKTAPIKAFPESESSPGTINIEIHIKRNRSGNKSSRVPVHYEHPKRDQIYIRDNHSEAARSNRRVVSSPHINSPTRGLVIMAGPLNQILSGEKTLELRSKHNRQLGPVALIKKGTGHVFGIAEITESIGPMSFEEFQDRREEHGVNKDRFNEVFDRGWVYGWRMRNVFRLSRPVPYIHKGMSQVKLDQKAIDEIQMQLDAA